MLCVLYIGNLKITDDTIKQTSVFHQLVVHFVIFLYSGCTESVLQMVQTVSDDFIFIKKPLTCQLS